MAENKSSKIWMHHGGITVHQRRFKSKEYLRLCKEMGLDEDELQQTKNMLASMAVERQWRCDELTDLRSRRRTGSAVRGRTAVVACSNGDDRHR